MLIDAGLDELQKRASFFLAQPGLQLLVKFEHRGHRSDGIIQRHRLATPAVLVEHAARLATPAALCWWSAPGFPLAIRRADILM